jgi:hypothetical protein
MMADFPETRTPPEVVELLKKQGLWGKPTGIYRLVSQSGIPESIWRGELGPPIEEAVAVLDGTKIRAQSLSLTLEEMLRRLTYGALGLIVDLHLPAADSDLWTPTVIRSMGFFPADRHARRFFNYLEISGHVDSAAWDQRAINVRVQVDVRRDFGWAFSLPAQGGGTISGGRQQSWTQPYRDRLSSLSDAIQKFAGFLGARSDAHEALFHDFLRATPILLDVYGAAVSKPRFRYPAGASPLGKAYVEPDFVIRYPGHRYRLVELERPGKAVATAQGQPRAHITQSTFSDRRMAYICGESLSGNP